MIKLGKDEKIIVVKRRHYMIFILELIPIVLMSVFLVGFIFYIFFVGFPDKITQIFAQYNFMQETNFIYLTTFYILLLLSLLWNFAFMIIAKHYLDCWIITDKRTIHTELRIFFSRFYSSVSHKKVQDITVDVCGIIPTIMNYGDIKIQTAGAFNKFVFRQIPQPHETKKILVEVVSNKTNYHE